MQSRAAALLLLLALAGCGSSPKTQFYTLGAVPAGNAARSDVRGGPIEVGHVSLPETLDRLSMVTRGSGDSVNVSDQDRWSAPLDGLVRRAVTADLRERLPPGQVLGPGDPEPQGARTLMLNVQQFAADASGSVVLAVDWSLQRSGKPGDVRQETIHIPVNGTGGQAVADAMSRALGELADRVAAAA